MRLRAKQCAGVVLAIAIPFFPAVGAPSQSLVQSSSYATFTFATPEATRAVHALDSISSVSPLVIQQTLQPPLEAKRPYRSAPTRPVAWTVRPGLRSSESQPSTPLMITVEEGQNPWQIAGTYGVSVEALLNINGLQPGDVIQVGQRLQIPQGTTLNGTTLMSTATRPSPQPAATSSTTPPSPALHYVIDQGDSLWGIAERYHVSVVALASSNGLTEESILYPGKRLTIPASDSARAPGSFAQKALARASTTVVVEPGQTLWSISRAYGVSLESLVAANRLESPEYIRAGQRVTIPGVAARMRRGTLPAPAVAPTISHRVVEGLQWPARGVMTSGFGWRRSHHHNGIDISANRGDPIRAAMAGTVIFTGWYGGYGLAVMIDHGDGLMTLYGHASRILVHSGDEVAAGEMVAKIGCTGVCTGPHLHFEIRLDGRPSNPLLYLP